LSTQSSYESHLESHRQKLEESESPSQVGFRRNYSTLNRIHILKQVAEESAGYRFPAYVALFDYKKAFDSMEWSAVWTALAKRGVHPALMIQRLYESSSTSVHVNSRTVTATMQKGVEQRDTLSPKLFNATLQMVLD
uniref:Reverse transcriptase domain-containing protein n=1 Tax=Haemonchus placei TaxID=6290 RepID=A0A0N4WB46_HAEPC